MIEPRALIDHAQLLVQNSEEVDVRRAVSAAYYALFHSFSQSCAALFEHAGPTLGAQIARSLEHAPTYKICKEYVEAAGELSIDPRLSLTTAAFVELQDARKQADYDLRADFSTTEAARLVENCHAVLRFWPEVTRSQQGFEFLLRLLLGPRLRQRG